MAKNDNTFLNRLSQANIMSDGMLKEVSEGDLAWMMVLKDKPNKTVDFYEEEPRNEFK